MKRVYESSNQVGGRRRRRHFTVDEANRSLVLVKRIVSDMVGGYNKLLDQQETLEAAHGKADQQVEDLRLAMVTTINKLYVCLQELEVVGAELRDWSMGVVDFPSRVGGREICLCWQYGEPMVSYWHEIGADFAGRLPIDEVFVSERDEAHVGG